MKTIILRRIVNSSTGCFGVLVFNEVPFALTLEREWLFNRAEVSCIPSGAYMCKRVDSPKFGNTFEVTDVVGRTNILFHKGNLQEDSIGCILIGEQFGYLGDDPGVLSSKAGYKEFHEILKGVDGFRLVIADDWKNPIN